MKSKLIYNSLLLFQVHRWQTNAVSVAPEEYVRIFAFGALYRLYPLADPGNRPQRAQKSSRAICFIRSIILAQDWFDGLGSFSGIVEGDPADEMVHHMGFDDVMEEMFTNEAEITINRGRGTTGEGPAFRVVMRKGRIGMLKVGDRN